MAIDFPNSPSINDQYTVGDRTWTWNGTYWQTSTSMSTFTASDSEPVDADPGDIWFDSTIGKTFINYSGTWVEIGNAATVVDVIADADADTKVQVESSADEDKIRFSTAGTERVIVDNAGRVGIGTTTPTVPLDVVGDTFVASASGDDYLNVDVQADDTRLRTRLSRSLSMDGQSVAISASDPDTETAVPLSISGDPVSVSNLRGIGAVDFTLADSVTLDGSITDYGTAVALNSGDNQLVSQVVTDGSTWGEVRAWNTNTEANIELYLTGSTVTLGSDVVVEGGDFTVDSYVFHVDSTNNKVGMGTTYPQRQLHVFDTLSGATGYGLTGGIDIESINITGINILSPNTGYGRIYFGSPVSNTAGAVEYIHNATVTDGYMKFRAGAADRMHILGNGNVGIATSSPGATLEVNGSIKATNSFVDEVGPTNVSSGWYTIATCISGRASARFDLHDPTSGRHQSTTFYVTTVYGQDGITVISHGYYSGGGPFQYIRVKGIGVYDGAAVQVYARASAYSVRLYMSDNYNEQRWVIKNFIPDATDPGGLQGTWSSFTQQVVVNLDSCGSGGGTIQTGPVNASAKNFSIPHPTREDYTLQHGALEGPEQGVYHRGKCTNGVIELPEYWDGLVDLETISIHLTGLGDYYNWVDSVDGRTINVGGGDCYFFVYGERKDIDKLAVEQYMYSEPLPIEEGAP